MLTSLKDMKLVPGKVEDIASDVCQSQSSSSLSAVMDPLLSVVLYSFERETR